MSTAHPVTEWASANAVTVLAHYLPETARRLSKDGRAPCPVHGGDNPDAFSFDRRSGLWNCFTGCAGGGDIVELVRHALRLSDRAAARDAIAADLAPLELVATGAPKRPRNRAQRPARAVPPAPKATPAPTLEDTLPETVRTARQTLRDGGMVLDTPRGIYTAAIRHGMTLGPLGHAYLKHRGLSPDVAWLYGFRSMESAADWARLDAYLAECFLDVERAAAMLPAWDEATDALGALPTHYTPALVIPYLTLDGDAFFGFRLRALTDRSDKYRALRGAAFPLPFNAPAFSKPGFDLARGEVHLVEGELNAYTLLHYGLNVVGIPGAGKWDPAWTSAIARATRIIAWYDKDTAGDKAWQHLQDTLAAYGGDTVRHLARFVIPPTNTPSGDTINDVNDWHRLAPDSLRKTLTSAPWRQ